MRFRAGLAGVVVAQLLAQAQGAAQRAQPIAAPPSSTNSAPAQGSTAERARALFQQGMADYHLGDYARAIDALKEGYRLSRAPGFLFNIAQAYRRKGDCAPALRFYREDLQAEPSAPYRKEVEERIAEMTRCVEDEQRAAASAQALVPASFGAVSSPVSTPIVAEKTPGRTSRITGMVLVGVGAALAGAATYYTVVASSRSNACTEVVCDAKAFPDIDNEGQTASTLATTFWIAGGAALVSGAIFWAYGAHRANEAQVAVAPTAGGAALVMRSRF